MIRETASDRDGSPEARELYIDLLKRSVSNLLYDDDLDLMRGKLALDPLTGKFVTAEPAPATNAQRYNGEIWPSRAHTMIGIPRLENLQRCVESVLREGTPGDLLEAGVWRGGATIFMRGILKAHGVRDRSVWVADSFRGLPAERPPEERLDSQPELHKFKELAVSLSEVRANFERYGLLDDQVRFLEGWFESTLPEAEIERLAVMRVDCDLYESTMDALVNLYDRVSPGGFVIVDDYGTIPGCNQAVDEFRAGRGISEELTFILGTGAFWKKQAPPRRTV